MRFASIVLTSAMVSGCSFFLEEEGSDPGTEDSGTSVVDPMDTDNPDPGTTDTGTPPDPTDPVVADWRAYSHPCFGNRTDAMLVEDRDHVWVGCGTTTEGVGLYGTEDGGLTWFEPVTNPTGWFDDFRVSSIQRGDDGLLYVAGIYTLGSQRVVSVDDSSSPAVILEVMNAGSTVGTSFHVGTFQRNSWGLAVAESLTGTDLMTRDSDDAVFQDGWPWWTSGNSYQMLDMVVHDDQFYGCGSTIAQPPTVFLPPPSGHAPGDDFAMVPIELAQVGLGAFDGELWGLDVDDGGVVVAGVDQNRNVGAVFISNDDPYDPANWTHFDVSSLLGDSDATWMRGACRNGDTLVAVGEYSIRNDAIVLRSEDGGATWADVTPTELGNVPALHRCTLFDDGDLYVAGGEGFFGVFDPSE